MGWLKGLLRGHYEEGPLRACKCDDVRKVTVYPTSRVAEHEECGGLLGADRIDGDWELTGETRGSGVWEKR